MWMLVIIFLYPHVGTSSTTEFMTKKACLEAKSYVDELVKERQTRNCQIKTACVYMGE